MTRSEWKQAWRFARNYRRHGAGFAVYASWNLFALNCLQCREARSAELGLSPYPSSKK
ncbi:TPA: hypothetical protein UNK10_000159 [Stenotrophomonas maltophilia]|nr:hypothetical protein [Stenotrophomonas maltophilia]HEL5613795.1 hypothetical protein [Stenotrophomonas maltophilia]